MPLNRGKMVVDGSGVAFSYGNQSPAVDAVPLAWKVGDRRFYVGGADPTLVGYECTVAGTPGTWVPITTGGGPPVTPETFLSQGVQDTRSNDEYDEAVAVPGQGSILTSPVAGGVLISMGVQDTRSNDEPDEQMDFMPGNAIPGQGGLVSGSQATLIDGSRVFLLAQGVLAESYDRRARIASSAVVLGTVYYMAVQLYRGDVVANVSSGVVATGTLTLAKVALYKKDGTQLAVSANSTATYGSQGLKTHALTAAYTVPVTDLYYLAIVFVGSAAPTLLGHTTAGAAAGETNGAIGSGSPPIAIQTGQTDMPSPGTLSSLNTAAISFWLAAS